VVHETHDEVGNAARLKALWFMITTCLGQRISIIPNLVLFNYL